MFKLQGKLSKIFGGLFLFGLMIAIIMLLAIESRTYKASPEALVSLVSNETVKVTNTNIIVFKPLNTTAKGIVFYPGGLVQAEAYSSLANKISKEGYLVVIAKMPFNLAVLNSYAADTIIKDFPQIENWTIMGHSLGGAMAAKYVDETSNSKISTLVLLAAYPPENNNLTDKKVKVVSIYGSNDKLLNLETYGETKRLLPETTKYVILEGGNHSGFGNYGQQQGDGSATIENEVQQYLVIKEILEII